MSCGSQGGGAKRRANKNRNKRPWLKLRSKPVVAQERMDAGDDDDDEEVEGREDIAKVKDNEIERPDDDDGEDSLGAAAGNFRVKKSRGKERRRRRRRRRKWFIGAATVWQDGVLTFCE